MSRLNNIKTLLKEAKNQLNVIEKKYKASLDKKEVPENLKVKIKNYLENLKSCLDYAAQDISEIVLKRNTKQKIYFPIVEEEKNSSSFEGSIGRNLPKLKEKDEQIYNMLERFQPYNKKNDWLANFSTLVNNYKHIDLVPQIRKETKQVRVKDQRGGEVLYSPGIFNDRGGITARKGQSLVIKAGGSVKVFPKKSFVMEREIDTNSQKPYNNEKMIVDKIIWVDFQFEGINKPSLLLLKKFYTGVNEVIDSIYNLIA